MAYRLLAAIIAWLALSATAYAQGEARFALVIGNEDYSGALTKLNRPHEDADIIGGALQADRFIVTLRVDQGRSDVLREARALANRLKAAGPEAVGFFYYSGHGASALVGDRRRNYMIPVGTAIETPDDLVAEGIPLDDIIAILQRSKAKAIFIVFDACRSELPWSKGGSDPDKAFNAVSAGPGMFIAYSTAEGTSAPDDGAFASALAAQLLEPGRTHLMAFDAAARSVGKTRGVDRRPWYSNQIDDDFYFTTGVDPNRSLQVASHVNVAPVAALTADVRAATAAFSGSGLGERAFRDRLRDGSYGPELVTVPMGSFLMGSSPSEKDRKNDEGPQRRVTIDYGLAIGKSEVSWSQYEACVSAHACLKASDDGFGGGSRPVTNVSWSDARAYTQWLSQQTGSTYRLPSESEWEYAARGGSSSAYPWGDSIGRGNANCDPWYCGGVPPGSTAPAESMPANAFGLHHMLGNVWEWVADCHGYATDLPIDGSAYQLCDSGLRGIRGGSWNNYPRDVRSAKRSGLDPERKLNSVGFRVAREITITR